MEQNIKEKRDKFIFRYSLMVSIVSMLLVLILTGIQVYIRWFINQSFTVVGGYQLEILTVSAFALIIYVIKKGV